MDRWLQRGPGHWRKEADLPIGHVVAEIHKQEYLPLYSTRVEVTFTQAHVPQQVTKTSIGLLNPAVAQVTCNRLLAEIIAVTTLTKNVPDPVAGPAGH
jgi:hypothetical protein